MEQYNIRLKLFLRSSDSGFTVIELLVSAFLGLIVTALCLSSTIINRNIMGRDTVRTRLNQNIRGSLDLLGIDVRVAGENLPSTFPAVEVINGASGAADELVVRRNLLDAVLPVCTSIPAASTTPQVFFAVAGTIPGCIYSGQTSNYNAWRDYRLGKGGEIDAFIYNTATKQGEFFRYNSENDNVTSYNIRRGSGTWANAYPASSSAIYILEEWRYKLNGELLQIVQNRDTADPLNVSFGVTGFQVQITMQDGTVKSAFTTADDWTDISAIEVQLSGRESFRRQSVDRSLTGRFFPRNILSH